ncbi:hypothetical protein BH11PLA2_BH11PLA2_31970 [soil metagenome]
MDCTTKSVTRKPHKSSFLPSYVQHVSFDDQSAAGEHDPKALLATVISYDEKYMPDDITKQHAKLMHYAAHRMHQATTPRDLRKWQQRYNDLRDRIVLGNRKLIYRAVRRRMAMSNRMDDLIGDCHIVLIQAVQVYNPWMGIRFSTYAYTCLIRALSRINQKAGNDWLSRSLSFDALGDGEPGGRFAVEPISSGGFRLDEFLRDDHPLLSEREKGILSRRFSFKDPESNPTLEKVGAEMGLSKERVRQVQTLALDKLRKALTETSAT